MAGLTERLLLVVDAQTGGAASEFRGLSGDMNKVQADADKTSGKFDGLKASIGGFVGALAGAAVGKLFTNFAQGAIDAGNLAKSMNSTTDEAGALSEAFGNVGLSFGDVLEIQAEFSRVALDSNGEITDTLADMGVELDKNANGTVNFQSLLVDTIDVVSKMEDGIEKSQTLMKLFGEEGGKQIARLISSGRSLSDILEQIGSPFSEQDYQNAQQFQTALTDLEIAGQKVAFQLGSDLLPVATAAIDVFGSIAKAASVVPTEMLLAAVATSYFRGDLSKLKPAFATFGGSIRDTVSINSTLDRSLAGTSTRAVGVGTALKGIGSAGVAALGGPLGIAIIGVSAGFGLISEATQDVEAKVLDAANALKEMSTTGVVGTAEISASVDKLIEDMSFGERLGYDLGNFFTFDWEDTSENLREDLEEAYNSLSTFQKQAADVQTTGLALADAFADGTLSSSDLSAAVSASGDAMAKQAASTSAAEAAMRAYADVSYKAGDAATRLLDLQDQVVFSADAAAEAYNAYAAAVDDPATANIDERNTSLINYLASLRDAGVANADAIIAARESAGSAVDDNLRQIIEAQQQIESLRTALRDGLIAPGDIPAAQAQIDALTASLEILTGTPSEVSVTANADAADGVIDGVIETASGVRIVIAGTDGGPAAIAYIQSIASREYPTALLNIESRNGPAVIGYIQSIAAISYLALVKIESRNGPAVIAYIQSIAAAFYLALIHIESRGGPAVIAYLNSIASAYRLAIINVESRGGPAVDSYLDSLAAPRVQTITSRVITTSAPSTFRTLSAESSFSAAPAVTVNPRLFIDGAELGATIKSTTSSAVDEAALSISAGRRM